MTFCTAWVRIHNGTEMYQEDRKSPADQETIHVADSSEIRTMCDRFVYKLLPYMTQVFSDVPQCKKCRNRNRLND